jgi:hypothetical protein
MADIAESVVQVQHLCWSRLAPVNTRMPCSSFFTDLGVFAAFEEWRNADETDVVVPKNGVLTFIAGYLEGVLEYYRPVSVPLVRRIWWLIPSKASLPVFSMKSFFSLL